MPRRFSATGHFGSFYSGMAGMIIAGMRFLFRRLAAQTDRHSAVVQDLALGVKKCLTSLALAVFFKNRPLTANVTKSFRHNSSFFGHQDRLKELFNLKTGCCEAGVLVPVTIKIVSSKFRPRPKRRIRRLTGKLP